MITIHYKLGDLKSVVAKLLETMTKSKIICFIGEVGAGKTTLINALCTTLGTHQTPSSPTFSIINEYTYSTNNLVFHIDLYRINKVEELDELGIENYLYSDEYCLIEWPEIVIPYLEEPYYLVTIDNPTPTSRILNLSLQQPQT